MANCQDHEMQLEFDTLVERVDYTVMNSMRSREQISVGRLPYRNLIIGPSQAFQSPRKCDSAVAASFGSGQCSVYSSRADVAVAASKNQNGQEGSNDSK